MESYKINKLLLVLVLGVLSPSLFAQQHEITGGASGQIGLDKDDSNKLYRYQISAGYDYVATEILQLGLQTSLNYFRADGEGVHSYELIAGPTFNFGGESLNDSYFVTFKVGELYTRAYGAKEHSLRLNSAIGKRFALSDSVTYKPYFNFDITRANRKNTYTYEVYVLNFSILL